VSITATVVGNALMSTVVTLLNMSAESHCAATLDRAHHAALPSTEGLGVLLSVVRTRLLAKNIRHLKSGSTHHSAQK
jgi:hypothetical protein